MHKYHEILKENFVDTKSIVALIDAEIATLQRAKSLLSDLGRSGAAATASVRPRKKHKLSKEARERIAAAQRLRWAKVRKAGK